MGWGIIYKVLSFALKKDNDLLFLLSLSRLFQSLEARKMKVCLLQLVRTRGRCKYNKWAKSRKLKNKMDLKQQLSLNMNFLCSAPDCYRFFKSLQWKH